jgi:hypothetical protein
VTTLGGGEGATIPPAPEVVDVILQIAARDASIASVLREICALDAAVRTSALDLVAAHLRTRAAAPDVLECVALLRDDTVAGRIREGLG